MPPPHQRESNSTEIGLDTTNPVLTTLRDAGSLTSIPYLQDAARLALEIIDAIPGARRDKKEAFQPLADDACGLVYAAILYGRGGPDGSESEMSKELLDNLRELVRTLTDIERFARKHASRNAIVGIIKHKSAYETIQQYRESLRQSLDVFGLQSSITIKDNIAHLVTQQAELVNEVRNLAVRDGERRASEQHRTDAERTQKEETGVKKRERKEVGHLVGTGRVGNHDGNRIIPQDPPARDDQPQASVPKGRETNPFRTANYALLRNEPPAVMSHPHLPAGYQSYSRLSHIHSPNGHFKLTTIAGDQNTTDSSEHIINTNSGNTTITTTTNSNNDSSVRISTGGRQGRRRRAL